jgi:hypothetical protein
MQVFPDFPSLATTCKFIVDRIPEVLVAQSDGSEEFDGRVERQF